MPDTRRAYALQLKAGDDGVSPDHSPSFPTGRQWRPVVLWASSDPLRRVAYVTLAFIALTAVMTAPLLWWAGNALPSHDDAYFSTWRLAWVAHQLPRAPTKLFDANIFYPAHATLGFSDAMLLLGVMSAPILGLGAHPVLAHNLLLFLGFVLSGVGAFVLARALTGQTGPAVLAGIIFAFAPYRFAHFSHLELQWACWMPLALWAAHRLDADGSVRYGILFGVFIALQGFSSLYYFAFFLPYLVVVMTLREWAASVPEPTDAAPARLWKGRHQLTGLSAAVLVATLLLTPYLLAYNASRAEHPPRTAQEVGRYSAVPSSYLSVADSNWLYTRLRNSRDSAELSLFPGVIAISFAAFALWSERSRMVGAYGAGLLVALLMSLGPKAGVYSMIGAAVPPLANLRAPARAHVLVLLSLAVLAAVGARRWTVKWSSRRAAGGLVVVCGLCLVEYWSAPVKMLRTTMRAPQVYQWLARQPKGTVSLVLPVSRHGIDYEPLNEYLSIYHWQPLVNGYSGFSPPGYFTTQDLLRDFPNPASVQRLRALSVSYVILNSDLYDPDEYGELATRLVASPDFGPPLQFRDPQFRAVVFPLRQPGRAHDVTRSSAINRASTVARKIHPRQGAVGLAAGSSHAETPRFAKAPVSIAPSRWPVRLN